MRSHRIVGAAAFLAAALGLFAVAGPCIAQNPRRTPIVEAIERVRGAVVNIHSERTVHGPASEEMFAPPAANRVNGMGTGIIIDPRGYIITNQHVVEDVSVIRVRLHDGITYDAKVVTRDSESDLALLKIESSRPLPVMPIGTSSDVMTGETVIAIGNAYGYEHSVTVGIVSAVHRDVTLNKDISYKALIQTDASINPGNSGGPLININGDLIGVNVAIRAGAQGIGFAIPVDSMVRVAADMMSVKKRKNLWHGIVAQNQVGPAESPKAMPAVQESLPGKLTMTAHTTGYGTLPRSLIVERAEPGSPAAKAELQSGDVVVQVADTRIATSLDLERTLLDRSAGETVPVLVRRGNEEKKLDLVLQSLATPAPTGDLIQRKLGLRLNVVPAEQVSRLNRQLHGGLVIAEVTPDSAAAKAGLQRGDILVGLHQWETLTLDNVIFVLSHPDLQSFNPLRFFIVRSGQVHKGWFQQID